MALAIRITIVAMMWVGGFTAGGAGIGLDELRQLAPGLDGSGVRVAQPEAGDPIWEVNPQAIGHLPILFQWRNSSGSTNQFPNSLGEESEHANKVGGFFYGATNGVAPGVQAVDNYEAGYFYSRVQSQAAIEASVVNQSFVFASQLATVDRSYDNFAARHGTVFISGVGNNGSPNSPSTAYNGIAVGAFDGQSSAGPTQDGRSKPDLTAPASQTSYSTPQVAGGAALLVAAANQGVGGMGSEAAASDHRTIKGVLLNGAEKPAGWTNGPSIPLDARYGAGILNLFRSYRQLKGGKRAYNSTTNYPAGQDHMPVAGADIIPARRGWDLNSVTSTVTEDGATHYCFALTGDTNTVYVLQATLVWAKQVNRSDINDLDLFLYDSEQSVWVASSESRIDNVEHLYVSGLKPGHYVIQVLKFGGLTRRVTNEETYGLVFDFGPPAKARITDAVHAPDGFHARLVGEPYETYIIKRTSDYQTWFPVLTNTVSGAGYFDFTDGAAAGSTGYFYRACMAP